MSLCVSVGAGSQVVESTFFQQTVIRNSRQVGGDGLKQEVQLAGLSILVFLLCVAIVVWWLLALAVNMYKYVRYASL
jgi:hypothetical protein